MCLEVVSPFRWDWETLYASLPSWQCNREQLWEVLMGMFCSLHQTPVSVLQLIFWGCKQHILAKMSRDGELLGRKEEICRTEVRTEQASLWEEGMWAVRAGMSCQGCRELGRGPKGGVGPALSEWFPQLLVSLVLPWLLLNNARSWEKMENVLCSEACSFNPQT